MVGVEIGRLYRLARRGEIETIEAYRLAQVLQVLKACLETTEIEQRLARDRSCRYRQRDLQAQARFMSNNSLIKRLEALERAIVTHAPELIFRLDAVLGRQD